MTVRSGRPTSLASAFALVAMGCLLTGLAPWTLAEEAPRGWLSWRGPEQTGVSRETGLPDKVSAEDALWVA